MKSTRQNHSLLILLLTFAAIPAALAQQPSGAPESLPPGIEKFLVKTTSAENAQVPFYLKPPASYHGVASRKYRVLFLCPYFNGDGLKLISGNTALLQLADKRGWFVVVPTFKQDKKEVQDRNLSYYYPEKFSGKAVLDALEMIKQKYPIATDGLLLQGYSGGAQFVHRFAIWAADRVSAVVVNSSSWFDAPTPSCASIA